jgi:hypothetical protein
MKRLGFVSDAGYRFERGVDFAMRTRGRAHRAHHRDLRRKAGPLTDTHGTLPRRDPVRCGPLAARILGSAGRRRDRRRLHAQAAPGTRRP